MAQIGPQDEDNVSRDRFTALAGRLRDRYSFAFGPPPMDEKGSPSLTSYLMCFNNADERQPAADRQEFFDTDFAMDRFVKACVRPTIVELTRQNEMENFNVRLRLLFSLSHPRPPFPLPLYLCDTAGFSLVFFYFFLLADGGGDLASGRGGRLDFLCSICSSGKVWFTTSCLLRRTETCTWLR